MEQLGARYPNWAREAVTPRGRLVYAAAVSAGQRMGRGPGLRVDQISPRAGHAADSDAGGAAAGRRMEA